MYTIYIIRETYTYLNTKLQRMTSHCYNEDETVNITLEFSNRLLLASSRARNEKLLFGIFKNINS